MLRWSLALLSLCLLTSLAALGKGRRVIEKHSSREDLASDVPQDKENVRFLVRDNIYGVRVSNQGAPVVQFHQDAPLIVGFTSPGTQVELNALRVHNGINYWPIDYKDEKGQNQKGWISGLFVMREGG